MTVKVWEPGRDWPWSVFELVKSSLKGSGKSSRPRGFPSRSPRASEKFRRKAELVHERANTIPAP
jgi:hypothetical protein